MAFRSSMNSYYEKMPDGTVRCIDSEIPFEIPPGWEWTRIGNVFNHASGKQQSSSNKHGGTPQKFITTSNLYWGYFVLDNIKVMNFTAEEIKTCSATKGDLLVCEGGAGYGRSAIWNYDYDICLQNHIHRLRPCVSGICEYVYHFIYLLKESNNLASVGTAMPGLSANRLKGLLLPFPPLSEQKRIVTKLGELLPQIEKFNVVQNQQDGLNRTIKESLKKSILQEAIQGRLVSQIALEGTAEQLLEEIEAEKKRRVKDGKLKKSALTASRIFHGDDNRYYEQISSQILDISSEITFDIPDSWRYCRLGDIAYLRLGKTPPRGEPEYWKPGEYPWVSIADMVDGGTIYHTKESISKEGARLFQNIISPAGSLIMSFKLTIGKISILGTHAFHNEAIVTICPYVISADWLKCFLPMIAQTGTTKDAIKGKTLNSKSLNALLIPLPPLLEQKRILAMIDKISETL